MSSAGTIRIAHLYPAEMNIYGDGGNVLTLVKRLEWRDIPVEVTAVGPGEPLLPNTVDLIFGGGGQDIGQVAVAADLRTKASSLKAAADEEIPMLVVCGTFQLFGHRFVTVDGDQLPGIGLFDLETSGADDRLIGNIVIDSDFGRLVGFENHSGRTTLGPGQAPLGQVLSGHGNDGSSGQEGARSGSIIGTYLHGPVLPKNPALADHLLQAALAHRGIQTPLAPLDDRIELAAAETAANRPR
jgi:CobQ-like glutamine amidotransferase family enzyme